MTEAPETPETGETRAVRSVARNGSGHFVRTVEDARKQERAYLLSAQGWSLRQIAEELGYQSRGAAPGGDQAASRRGREGKRHRGAAGAAARRDDRVAAVVTDDDGEPVPDVQAMAAAAGQIIRAAEDQLGALGLILNCVLLWNTRYISAALDALRAQGHPVPDDDVARLSPFVREHLNVAGKYNLLLPDLGEATT